MSQDKPQTTKEIFGWKYWIIKMICVFPFPTFAKRMMLSPFGLTTRQLGYDYYEVEWK